MRNVIPVFIILSLFSFVISCDRSTSSKESIKTEQKAVVEDTSDIEIKNLQSSDTYPFSIANKIKIYSYENRSNWDDRPMSNSSVIPEDLIKDGEIAFDTSQLKEKVELDSVQSEELFNILYNFQCIEFSSSMCYDPRHAAFFYDENGMAFAAIEFCLDCENFITSPNVTAFDFCTDNVIELSQFLSNIGITYFEEKY